MFNNIGIPVYFFSQFTTRKFRAYSAELNPLLPRTSMNRTFTRFRPLFTMSIRFNTTFAYSFFFFPATNAALAASCYFRKVYIPVQFISFLLPITRPAEFFPGPPPSISFPHQYLSKSVDDSGSAPRLNTVQVYALLAASQTAPRLHARGAMQIQN